MPKKIALLTVYPPDTVPGLRFRIEQYLPLLQAAGYDIGWVSFFAPHRYEAFRSPHASTLRKGTLFLQATLTAFAALRKRTAYQGVFLYREASLWGTPFLEKLWTAGQPYILDFDDAIWLLDTSEANRAFAWLKNPRKTEVLLRRARVVTVCNAFLAAYARQFASDVRIIPTTIDTDLYQPRPKPERPYVVIGWSGSFTTLKHLRTIEGVLEHLYQRYKEKVRFRFIGAPQYRPPFPAEVLPWRAETEVADLSEIDIGVMPLPADDWSRGKCALKALQYMALGIPAVVSPVGMNTTVIQDGQNGLWADTPEAWIDKLSYLIEHPEERERLGSAGRKTVEREYSVRANFPKYLAAFEAAFGPV